MKIKIQIRYIGDEKKHCIFPVMGLKLNLIAYYW